jgi:hypothetical protein
MPTEPVRGLKAHGSSRPRRIWGAISFSSSPQDFPRTVLRQLQSSWYEFGLLCLGESQIEAVINGMVQLTGNGCGATGQSRNSVELTSALNRTEAHASTASWVLSRVRCDLAKCLGRVNRAFLPFPRRREPVPGRRPWALAQPHPRL